ncbi:hypothetical protein IM660_00895 [Ruania alkalisoli]|uniref:DUF6286 domain-containing protein n=1 Tax=Ruania alkalisoli TaxID=2779775 RepID=A0A7M1STL7_9MICO|nr:DUF6286 domain-containing protein [Ruania alkalisoli]QOR70910.1 hypothetical protein IM660_00895 [Ruania alkalisoli]
MSTPATSETPSADVPRLAAAPGASNRPGLRVAVVLVLLVLVGVAALLSQHALAAWAVIPDPSWLEHGIELISAQSRWVPIVAAAAVALGVLLLVLAWPRRQRVHRLSAAPALHLRTVDLARLASAAAREVDGVLAATTTVSGRRIRVHVTATGLDGISEDVHAAVQRRLALVAGSFRIRPQVRTPDGSGPTGDRR